MRYEETECIYEVILEQICNINTLFILYIILYFNISTLFINCKCYLRHTFLTTMQDP